MTRRHSLAARLSRHVTAGFAAVWLLALVATALALMAEQEELADITIQRTAQVFLPAVASDFRQRNPDAAALPVEVQGAPRFDPAGDTIDKTLVYRLLDRSGRGLMQSRAPEDTVYPDSIAQGFARTASHVFYTTAPNAEGFIMQVGDLRAERFEAYADSFLALTLPMLAILPLAWLLVGWIGRRSLAPLDRLRDEIAQRGDARLDPIEAEDQPDELRAITATLNGFMIRLSRALDGERAFATNAAHELRTPVAIALAQVQRLRAEAPGAPQDSRLAAIEEALKRMTRLVVRLLQLARTDAGIGLSDQTRDIRALLDLMLEDIRRDPARAPRLRAALPDGPVMARIDPDALAMLVGNLIDNAFQHAPAASPVSVTLSPGGTIRVQNDGPVIPPDTLRRLSERFHRGTARGEGFGLGLHIAERIAHHTGGTFEIVSPRPGSEQGFQASFTAPTE
ncbi:sensor histidine kinase [Oceaniglobus trochenteri]|uniref:sensor histidine kinase n=1 Tax=Oceaniglobus trochenteri TaxID=2763260 RepID=UPI001CFFA0F4|nr:ATP-binding protein [Oceaniglobus trochenteri]